MDTEYTFLSGEQETPPYSRSQAIELLYAAGLTRFEAIGVTRVGPELVREYLEAHPRLVVSEYLMRMVGVK